MLTLANVSNWPSQVEDLPRLVAGNLSFNCSPRPHLGEHGDRPVLAELSRLRLRSTAVFDVLTPRIPATAYWMGRDWPRPAISRHSTCQPKPDTRAGQMDRDLRSTVGDQVTTLLQNAKH